MSGIHVQDLGKRFGDRVAVEALSFHVRPGEVFGLLGPNGAGKTTTVRMLTGLLQPTEGEATVWGHRVDRDGEPLRKVVGLLTEQPGLYDRLTARENLRFFMKLHELDEAAAWPRARHYLERFGLGGREEEPVGGFSKGMRQKLAIVRTLVHDPKVIFLDEPTSGLDPESARTVRDAVAELASEGRTIVLCSHNLAEVERLCERVAVVKRRLLAMGPVRELRHAGQALEVRVEGEAERFCLALAQLPFAPNVLAEGPKLRVMLADDAQAPDVVACLVGAGARVHSAVPTQRPLEEVYLELLREGRG
ncbi:ABC transporter, ATP-binding protein [Myxococcus xanthus DK 1622]|uniref:ABC transporter, ATP-binding protein n=1 Tax=Myxococcus xanthus (strain DK1622) TaxID=246197 RepID=Q1D0V0_MYXXD|nr:MULTISPECIES: ABC transporter ATP-binding protein [Myxococcus]ABF87664.1 ABC transporter, ATP-binding protein [Myxococcus xanthus DK 1622]NOJ54057.1 ABC transporter ATP-binding protein [Myxococcus xanthus]QPM78014.1 ABC transporter ATP-binding protein [Myxococcus xanthus]QVW67082.1 ABC transporter ATP-binding protein [Myxococcus xanthus DZ2]QZZ53225.1 Linearmycin resistance ATP-binding protein LnrL [Myxococcus xanthus]